MTNHLKLFSFENITIELGDYIMPLHIILAVIFIIIALIWGDWRNWVKYYPTILFFAVGDLTYDILFKNKLLWKHVSPFLPAAFIDMIWTIILYPCIVLVFLPHYPKNFKSKFIYLSAWILGFTFIELGLIHFGYFVHLNGWNMWWSFGFYIILFPLLKLHEKNPLCAILVSFIWVTAVINIFHIPI